MNANVKEISMGIAEMKEDISEMKEDISKFKDEIDEDLRDVSMAIGKIRRNSDGIRRSLNRSSILLYVNGFLALLYCSLLFGTKARP